MGWWRLRAAAESRVAMVLLGDGATEKECAMAKTEQKSLPRREFLKAAGVTGTVAGVAAVSLSGKSVSAATPESGKAAGYQETEHVNTYYELARF